MKQVKQKKFTYTFLFYGEIKKFESYLEMQQILNSLWKEKMDKGGWECPICGKEFHHLRCVIANGEGIPRQINLCSKECVRKMMNHLDEWRNIVWPDIYTPYSRPLPDVEK